MDLKTVLSSHTDRFMDIVSKMRNGKYILLWRLLLLLASYDILIWILEISN